MANFDTIKTAIDANIKTNGTQDITGGKMNSILKQMVDATDAELTELESEVGAAIDLSSLGISVFDSNGTWTESSGYSGVFLPCKKGDKFVMVAGAERKSLYSQVVSIGSNGESVVYASGQSITSVPINSSSGIIEIVEGCNYLWVGISNGSTDITPKMNYYGRLSVLEENVGQIKETTENNEKSISDLDGKFDDLSGEAINLSNYPTAEFDSNGTWTKSSKYNGVFIPCKQGEKYTLTASSERKSLYSQVVSMGSSGESVIYADGQSRISVPINSSSGIIEIVEGCNYLWVGMMNDNDIAPSFIAKYGDVIGLKSELNLLQKSVENISKQVVSIGYSSELTLVGERTYQISVEPNINTCYKISMRSKYSSTSLKPSIRYVVGDYRSREMEIGDGDSYKLQEFRIPPRLSNMGAIYIVFTIPSECTLNVKDMSVKETDYINREAPIRFNAHLGFQSYAPQQSLESFVFAEKCGFCGCIVNPIRSADGVWMCYHEDKVLLSLDGINNVSLSAEEFQSMTYEQLMDYTINITNTYFPDCKIPKLEDFLILCAKTGMKPVFSLHPIPNIEGMNELKTFLEKYGLIKNLELKCSSVEGISFALQNLGGTIDSAVVFTSSTSVDYIKAMVDAFDAIETSCKKGFEVMDISMVTDELCKYIIDKGMFVVTSGIKDTKHNELIKFGVTEFTEDYNCNNGLMW